MSIRHLLTFTQGSQKYPFQESVIQSKFTFINAGTTTSRTQLEKGFPLPNFYNQCLN